MTEKRDAYERARSNAGEDRITLKSVELADAVIKARARYKAETGKDLKKDRITTEDLKNPDPNEGTKIKKAYDKAKKNKGQDRVTAEDIKFHLKNPLTNEGSMYISKLYSNLSGQPLEIKN